MENQTKPDAIGTEVESARTGPYSIVGPTIMLKHKPFLNSEEIETLADRILEELESSGFFSVAPNGTDLKLCEVMYKLGAMEMGDAIILQIDMAADATGGARA